MDESSTLRSAPLFELPNQKGRVRTLAEYLEGGPVLLAFHRGTW
jgi:peroxiredoxin